MTHQFQFYFLRRQSKINNNEGNLENIKTRETIYVMHKNVDGE